MLIGFTDDSLAGIIANILADVANVWLIMKLSIINCIKIVKYNFFNLILNQKLPIIFYNKT